MKRVRESLADRELSLNLSDDAADLLVEKGWDPAMGARPLRRAIQRYIEDPLADEVLAQNLPEGSTVEVDRDHSDDKDKEVDITITKPARKREAVGVGAEGGKPEGEAGDEGSAGDLPAGDLPEDPDVLPDVPDAPPSAEDEGGGADSAD
jgi:ATP-dependent Clp protease ATP-binding subunit ClpC